MIKEEASSRQNGFISCVQNPYLAEALTCMQRSTILSWIKTKGSKYKILFLSLIVLMFVIDLTLEVFILLMWVLSSKIIFFIMQVMLSFNMLGEHRTL